MLTSCAITSDNRSTQTFTPWMTKSLFLSEDVFFCVTEGHGIFLDLKRDDYNAIPIPGLSRRDEAHVSEERILEAFAAYRQELLEGKLISEESAPGGSVQAYKAITRPASHVFDPDDDRAFGLTGEAGRAIRIQASDVIDFFLASRSASQQLKKRHIHDVVVDVRKRKAAASGLSVDRDAFRRHTAVFRKLRPWYPRAYLCLYDGLALVEFLARRGVFPTWVFGVQAQPFNAHCWVQAGDCLLNETLEYARQFTPIMAV